MKRFYYRIVTLMTLATAGCQEDVKRQIQAEEVTINDSNILSVSDSIYFILNSYPNKITLLSDVADANLHYSINNGPFNLSASQSITLQKQDSILHYYFAKKNFNNSVVKTIVFPKHAKRFLNKIPLNPIITDSSLPIKIIDKSRGVLRVEVYNLNGTKLIERSHLKKNDELAIEYTLDNYSPGKYILLIRYGSNHRAYQLIKQ